MGTLRPRGQKVTQKQTVPWKHNNFHPSHHNTSLFTLWYTLHLILLLRQPPSFHSTIQQPCQGLKFMFKMFRRHLSNKMEVLMMPRTACRPRLHQFNRPRRATICVLQRVAITGILDVDGGARQEILRRGRIIRQHTSLHRTMHLWQRMIFTLLSTARWVTRFWHVLMPISIEIFSLRWFRLEFILFR